MGPLKQSIKLYSPSRAQREQMLGRLVLVLLSLNMMGCNILPKTHQLEAENEGSMSGSRSKGQPEIEYAKLMIEKEAQQHEIERLQKLLAEKEAYIRSQEARQQDQAKALQESSSQAAHANVKLRRLATRPAAASTIAEVEMVMGNLKSSPITGSEQVLHTQAQLLLSAAATAYGQDNYAAAMDYAAQAREFIDMIRNNRIRKVSDPQQVTISFQVPIPLRAKANSNLRQKPGLRAAVLGMLKKDATVIAEAYRGDWLQILTADGRSGWVFNSLVEAQVVSHGRGGQVMGTTE